MSRKLYSSPLAAPVETVPCTLVPIGVWCGVMPSTRRATALKISGARAWASVRRRVLTLSARPHSPAGMMSSRAASRGGLAADKRAAPATSNQIAGVSLLATSPGMRTSAAAI